MKIKRFIVTVIVCAVVLLTAALLNGYCGTVGRYA